MFVIKWRLYDALYTFGVFFLEKARQIVPLIFNIYRHTIIFPFFFSLSPVFFSNEHVRESWTVYKVNLITRLVNEYKLIRQ